MKMITIAGTASCGKTSVIIQLSKLLSAEGIKPAVVKFDCISSHDGKLYDDAAILNKTGLSGALCPDHFYVSNIVESWRWAEKNNAGVLIIESAGLCNRCSPHIKDIPAICVIDNLSGINTPHKIGPMLKTADIVVITKGDIVSQAEREVFAYRVRQANARCRIVSMNGLTGQGSFALLRTLENLPCREQADNLVLRFTMPEALCSYCLGERKIGYDYQIGNTKTMRFDD